MSQAEILEFLGKNKGKWFSSNEIIKALGNSNSTTPLFKLRRFGLVHWVREEQRFLYKSK